MDYYCFGNITGFAKTFLESLDENNFSAKKKQHYEYFTVHRGKFHAFMQSKIYCAEICRDDLTKDIRNDENKYKKTTAVG